MKEQIKWIADYYGKLHQSVKLCEELGELTQAVAKYVSDAAFGCSGSIKVCDDITAVACEMADVKVMMDQVQYLLDIPNDIIDQQMDYKLKRQIKRIEKK